MASSRPLSSSSTPSTSANNLPLMTASRFALPATSVRSSHSSSLSSPSSARGIATVSDNNNDNPSRPFGGGAGGTFSPLPNVTTSVSATPKTHIHNVPRAVLSNSARALPADDRAEPRGIGVVNVRHEWGIREEKQSPRLSSTTSAQTKREEGGEEEMQNPLKGKTIAGSSFSTLNKAEAMFPPIANIHAMMTPEGQKSSSSSHALPFRSADAFHSRAKKDDGDETQQSGNGGNALVSARDRPNRALTTNLISAVESPPPPPIRFVPTLPSMPAAVVSRASATTTGNIFRTPRGRGRGGVGVNTPSSSFTESNTSPRKTNLLNSPSHASTNVSPDRAATTHLAGVGGGERRGESSSHTALFSSDPRSSSPTTSAALMMSSFKGKKPLRKL